MEKWSAIHNVYKFFNLGRPPQMIIIESNKKVKKRIDKLRKLMNYHKKNNTNPPDLSFYSMKKLDFYLNKSN